MTSPGDSGLVFFLRCFPKPCPRKFPPCTLKTGRDPRPLQAVPVEANEPALGDVAVAGSAMVIARKDGERGVFAEAFLFRLPVHRSVAPGEER